MQRHATMGIAAECAIVSGKKQFSPGNPQKRTTGCLWLREHVGDGDSTGHMALDDELHRVSDSQDCGGRMRPRSVWNGFRADDRPG